MTKDVNTVAMGILPTDEAELPNALTVIKTVLTLPVQPEHSVTDRAVFTYGYAFQSRVLCIPDRWGLFWPGPAEAQQEQGYRFSVVTFCCVLVMVLLTPSIIILMYVDPWDSHIPLIGSLVVGNAWLLVIMAWVASFYDKGRNTKPVAMCVEAQK
ncbi:hypothetical protein DL546_004044 [Coniochaeta pulveracea]|uniref:Uncharacterized protein n=1 Tax=Coniochaeta pulveracea TaxID=177199 RepID=A0A420Y1P4_9PEZI|nr:hypothetical protein DL546_004044 [Coniochaeta pulveracea]